MLVAIVAHVLLRRVTVRLWGTSLNVSLEMWYQKLTINSSLFCILGVIDILPACGVRPPS